MTVLSIDRTATTESPDQWQARMIRQRGFYVDYFGQMEPEPLKNTHTHGLEQFGHRDFQIVLPLDPKTMYAIFTYLVERVKSGERFGVGDYVTGVVQGKVVRLVSGVDARRVVLRVVLPDPNGLFWDDAGCEALYAAQHDAQEIAQDVA